MMWLSMIDAELTNAEQLSVSFRDLGQKLKQVHMEKLERRLSTRDKKQYKVGYLEASLISATTVPTVASISAARLPSYRAK